MTILNVKRYRKEDNKLVISEVINLGNHFCTYVDNHRLYKAFHAADDSFYHLNHTKHITILKHEVDGQEPTILLLKDDAKYYYQIEVTNN